MGTTGLIVDVYCRCVRVETTRLNTDARERKVLNQGLKVFWSG